MFSRRELENAIADCENRANSYSDCEKLATYYTVYNQLYAEQDAIDKQRMLYSQSAPPETVVEYDSGTEFSEVINGQNAADVWAVMDHLMDVLRAINPRLYNSTLDKIEK